MQTTRTPLRMPKMSMTMESGELTVWRVAVGDVVGEGDVLCEVLTDKVDMEVEAPAAGTVVEIDVEVGASVPVGTPLAWIETESDSLLEDLLAAPPAPPPTAPPPAPPPAVTPAVTPAAAGSGAGGIVPAIPGARRLAAEANLDLAAVPGSGPGGAVLVSDVRAVLAAPRPTRLDAPQPVAAPPAAVPRPGADGPGATVWRDVVLGPADLPQPQVLARVVAGVAVALATCGPAGVREQPRVGVRVSSAAGPVTLTMPDALADIDDVLAAVEDAVAQARSGRVDVAYLGRPDVVVLAVPGVDRLAVRVQAPAALAIGVGAASARVVPVGDGIGVRTVVTLGAAGGGWAGEPETLGLLLTALAGAMVRPPARKLSVASS